MTMLQSTIAPLALTSISGTSRNKADQPLRIRGRAAGLVGWIFTKLRLSDDIALELHAQDIRMTLGSLKGVVNVSIPLSQVSSTACAYAKPIWALFVSAFFFLSAAGELLGRFGSAGEGMVLAVVALGAAAWYVLNKTLRITIETTGGALYGVAVKRSVIEGLKLELEDAVFVIERLNEAVVSASARQRTLNRVA
jgi:hypothetical protein